jgi:hypothetical protein
MGQLCRGGLIFSNLKNLPGIMVQLFIAASIIGLCLSGCVDLGGGGSNKNDNGDVVVGLTDAASDFIKYEVQIVSLILTKQGGGVVQVLPANTTVDFAQYVDMTEFLTAATIPAGRYLKATLSLDYQNADIRVADHSGDPVPVDTNNILAENGVPISTLSVTVQLQGRNSLFIAPGIPAHLTLDFDLGASNQMDFTDPTDPILTVHPTLIADVNPAKPKVHRLRGPLKQVNVADNTFSLIIRPFIHVISSSDEGFGTLNVVSNTSTYYDINGFKFKGNAGLEVLDGQEDLAAVIVIGDLNITTRQFEATQVYAGSSVPGGTLDVVTGNVISRTFNQITVKGVRLIRAGGEVVFNGQINIQLGVLTKVNRQHSTDGYTIDDISVGQHIMAFGELDNRETELDVTQGYVGLLPTTVKGTVVSTAGSNVNVKLTAIDGRKIDLFDFTGTGAAADADPESYEVKTGSLNTAGLQVGDPVKLRGFVTEFGHYAGSGDFVARTMVQVSDVKGLMMVTWEPPSSDAITDLSADNFALDLSGAGLFHHLNRAGIVTDLTALGDAPIIESQNLGDGFFQIVETGSREIFFTYDDFIEELTLRMDSSSVTYIVSTGKFDDTNMILTTDYLIVGLQ